MSASPLLREGRVIRPYLRYRGRRFLVVAYTTCVLLAFASEIRAPLLPVYPRPELVVGQLTSLLLITGGGLGLSGLLSKQIGLERIGASYCLGAALLGLIEVLLLLTIPAWPDLVRPVLTTAAQIITICFFGYRLGELAAMGVRKPGAPGPVRAALDRADELRENQ